MTSQTAPAINNENRFALYQQAVARLNTTSDPSPAYGIAVSVGQGVTLVEPARPTLTPLATSSVIFTTKTGVQLTARQVAVLVADYCAQWGTDGETAYEYVVAGDDLDAQDGQSESYSTVEPNGTWNHNNKMSREAYSRFDYLADKYDV